VPEETRKVLLGHKYGDLSTHYSAAELRELIEAVQKIDASRETPMITVLRPVECLANVLQKNKGPARAAPKCVKSGAPGRIEPTTPWFVVVGHLSRCPLRSSLYAVQQCSTIVLQKSSGAIFSRS
jgi:hypothetical protein